MFLLLQVFGATRIDQSLFQGWQALVPAWSHTSMLYMVGISLLAKAVVFFPQRPSRITLLTGFALILFLQLLETRLWEPGLAIRMTIVVLFGLTGAILRRLGRAEARLFGYTVLWLLFISWVNLTPRNFMETTAMIGAVTLAAQIIKWFPQRQNLATDYTILALLGLMVTGWAGMLWSGKNLEWHAVYQWASPGFVEQYVVFFVPFIALKGLVPWLIILFALHERLGGFRLLPSRTILLCYSAKLLSLLATTIGLGGIDINNRDYLETATVVAVFAMLYLGVILLPGAWPSSTGLKRDTGTHRI